MKKTLGLDLGVASIGWALISENQNKKDILGMGSRIIPLSTDDKDEFSSGNKISKNQKRTARRTQRKGYDRYQMRRKALTSELIKHDMFDDGLFSLNAIDLWNLRSKAVNEKITLKELGRVLYHLNQKRGYKSSRADASLDKKDTDYVAEVKNRHQQIRAEGLTIGQHFYKHLKENESYRVKQQVFPREAYLEEFEVIINQQRKHHKIITDELSNKLRDEIIYYQRKLKSQKGLVNVCEFEGFYTKTKDGKEIFAGPKVAPKSSPLFQVCKIWESINTITLKNKKGENYEISLDKKQELFKYLDNNEKLSSAKLFAILDLKKGEGWYSNKQIERGIQGNLTKMQLLKFLPDTHELLKFELNIQADTSKEVFLVDKKTGEITNTNHFKAIAPNIESQPLYKLWHTIYSIPDIEECTDALINNFNIERSVAEKLGNIDFTKFAFGNKSVKAIRKILPYLMEGSMYSDACSYAGYNHSNSLTKDENSGRQLLDILPNLPKNSLRQPIVEKILNQMINLINAITGKYGKIDEIRIELARELKQSKDERNEAFYNLNKRERENEAIRSRITGEYGLRSTRNNVIKWRLFHEINNDESKLNATCIYCGKSFGISDALRGNNIDIEHIIPRSLLFDDSQSNKTLSHRSCNEAKNNRTAFDYMSSKTPEELHQYIERIDTMYKNKIIGKAKRDKLLMPFDKIPKDFIERQLRETQYIAKKAKEILEQVCTNVWSTSGSVTEYLRRIWGWEDALMNLQLPKYRDLGLTEWKEWETKDGQQHKQEVIKDWSKRDDHRHHAIDALVIACTQQGFIQRINTLSSKSNRDEMYAEVGKIKKGSLLENYMSEKRPFTTKEVQDKAAEVLVSFKAGKKVASMGIRKIKKDGKKQVVQKQIIIPRGPLSEESVYGKIKTIEKNKLVKYLFENPQLIVKEYIKQLVENRLDQNEGNVKAAFASTKIDPIYLDDEKKKILEHATCYKKEYVIKYPLESIKAKDAEYIVDPALKEIVKVRLAKHGNKEKDAFKDLENNPVWFNEQKKIPVKTVRMFTGLSSVVPVKKDENGEDIGFVKPGNNHHIAFYTDESGKKVEHICTFWHAVERKKYKLPIIIENPKSCWNEILSNKENYPESFLKNLPSDKWIFNESIQQNEMFIVGLNKELVKEAIRLNDKKTINQNLYRIQKMTNSDYWLRLHTETQLEDGENAKIGKRYFRCKSIGAFEKLNPVKVKINNLGEIVS